MTTMDENVLPLLRNPYGLRSTCNRAKIIFLNSAAPIILCAETYDSNPTLGITRRDEPQN
jgi:hypothetical protein